MPDLAREIERHEAIAKRRSLLIHELYFKSKDKEKAGRLIEDFVRGRLTYRKLVRELRKLANENKEES